MTQIPRDVPRLLSLTFSAAEVQVATSSDTILEVVGEVRILRTAGGDKR